MHVSLPASHILPRRPEPPVHRAEGTLNGIPHPAYGLVHGRIAPCQGLVLLRLVHDADQRIFLVGTSPYQAYCVASLNIKNLISPTLLNCVLKAFALALKDSTEAFVSLSSK